MATRNENREGTGRYTYDINALCVCGHTLGCHGPTIDIAKKSGCDGTHNGHQETDDACDCKGFKKAKENA